MPTRLERLQIKEAQVKAQIQRVLAAQKAAERKKETRRKFLIGDAVLAQIRSGELVDFDLSSVMDQFLIQPSDRALFDLEPIPVEEADSEVADKESTGIEVSIDAQRNALADDPLEPLEQPSIPPAAKTKAKTKKGSAAKKKR